MRTATTADLKALLIDSGRWDAQAESCKLHMLHSSLSLSGVPCEVADLPGLLLQFAMRRAYSGTSERVKGMSGKLLDGASKKASNLLRIVLLLTERAGSCKHVTHYIFFIHAYQVFKPAAEVCQVRTSRSQFSVAGCRKAAAMLQATLDWRKANGTGQ